MRLYPTSQACISPRARLFLAERRNVEFIFSIFNPTTRTTAFQKISRPCGVRVRVSRKVVGMSSSTRLHHSSAKYSLQFLCLHLRNLICLKVHIREYLLASLQSPLTSIFTLICKSKYVYIEPVEKLRGSPNFSFSQNPSTRSVIS